MCPAGCASSLERTSIHDIEPEFVEQARHDGFRSASSPAIARAAGDRRAGRSPVGRKLSGVDVIERLDDSRGRQVRLEQFGGRGRLVVELRYLPVALGVVVVGVDHDLPGERLDRHGPVMLERNGDDDDLADVCDLGDGGRARVSAEFANQRRQRLRSPRVAEDDLVAVQYGHAGDLAANVSSSD